MAHTILPPQNKSLSFSKTKALSTLAVASFALFAIASIQDIYYKPEIKILFDIARGSCILLFIALYFINNKLPKIIFIFGLFSIIWSIALKDWFFLDASCGAIISVSIIKLNKHYIIRSISWTLIIITILTIALSKIGLIQSTTFSNTLYSDVALSTGSKESFGFWQPNVVSLLAISCLIAGFYLDDKKLLIISSLVYLFIIQETLSRTYIPIPILILIFYAFKKFSIQRSMLISLPFLIVGLSSLFIAWLIIIPKALDIILSSTEITALDQLLSYRISIAKRVIEPLSGIEMLTGIHDKKLQIDSLFANYIISQGLLLFTLASILISYIMLKLFQQRKTKELLIISLYLLISNFESTASVSSLIFVIFISCCFESRILLPKKKKVSFEYIPYNQAK